MTYKTKPGAMPEIRINTLNYLPQARLVLALKRLRAAIAEGRALEFYDDDTVGNKSGGCSWGLCHDSAQTWPDAQDHTFPVDFEKRGRISTLDSRRNNACPLDRRNGGAGSGGNGCFYTCRVFKPERGQAQPTREQALELYDRAIVQEEARR